MSAPRPFEKAYVPTLLTALLALTPYILVTSAGSFYEKTVMQQIGTGRAGMALISALATAGYAFGAFLGGDLINRISQRTLFLLFEAVLAAGWALSAVAGGAAAFGSGQVIAGFSTGILLVAALPPVLQKFPAGRVPISAAFINIALFGGVAAGPLVGALASGGSGWRWLFAGFAAVAVLIDLLALLTLPDEEPLNPDLPFDRSGLALGLGATVLPFAATAALTARGFGAVTFLAPLLVGLACFYALVLLEYRKEEPLAPVKQMWTTIPLGGTLAAIVGGGAFVTLLRLAGERMLRVEHIAPLTAGLSFWPELVGTVLAAAAMGWLLRTRYLVLLVAAGGALLVVGAAMLMSPAASRPGPLLMAAAGLLGFGAGATVSPGLFLAGFALSSKMLGRIFALVELVRSVGDFILAPLLGQAASTLSLGPKLDGHGVRLALAIMLGVTLLSLLFGILMYWGAGQKLQVPDVETWLDQDEPAIESNLLFQRFRPATGRA